MDENLMTSILKVFLLLCAHTSTWWSNRLPCPLFDAAPVTLSLLFVPGWNIKKEFVGFHICVQTVLNVLESDVPG